MIQICYVYIKAEQKILSKVGDNIRKRRLELKITQAQLAFELSTDGRHIRRIENGEVNPSFLTLYRIAQVLEIDLTTLIKIKG